MELDEYAIVEQTKNILSPSSPWKMKYSFHVWNSHQIGENFIMQIMFHYMMLCHFISIVMAWYTFPYVRSQTWDTSSPAVSGVMLTMVQCARCAHCGCSAFEGMFDSLGIILVHWLPSTHSMVMESSGFASCTRWWFHPKHPNLVEIYFFFTSICFSLHSTFEIMGKDKEQSIAVFAPLCSRWIFVQSLHASAN